MKKKLKLDDFKVKSFMTSPKDAFGAAGVLADDAHTTIHTKKSVDMAHCCSSEIGLRLG